MSRAELVVTHDAENLLDWPDNCWNDDRTKERRTYTHSEEGSKTTIIQVVNGSYLENDDTNDYFRLILTAKGKFLIELLLH